MQNSNLVHIVLDYLKEKERKKERKERAKKLNKITELCKEKKLRWRADIDKGICIGGIFFSIDELEMAMKYVEELDTLSLNYYKECTL